MRLLLYQVAIRLLLLNEWDYTFCQSEKQGNYFYALPFPQQANAFLSHSRFARAQDSLCSICHLQFAEYIRDMIAHCFQAEH